MKPAKMVNTHAHFHTKLDIPERVREWRSHNCVKACVSALPAAGTPPNDIYLGNEELLKWMKEFKDIVVGMAAVELGPHLYSRPDDLDRFRDQGFGGLKFIVPAYPYDHDRYMPLYERAEKLRMPILFHTGWVAQLGDSDRRDRPSSDYMRPYRLDRIARSFTDLKIIGAHLGLPHADEAVRLLSGMKNVYFDISGGGGGEAHRSLIKKALAPFPGADWDKEDENLALGYFKKIVFGTDNPPIGRWYPAAEAVMDYLHVPDSTRELFYWKNAAEIFGWTL